MRDIFVENEDELFDVLLKYYFKSTNILVLGNPHVRAIYLPEAGVFIKPKFELSYEELVDILAWLEVLK